MNETLNEILFRLEQEIKELKLKVVRLENSKSMIEEKSVSDEIKSIVDIKYITELYRG